MVDGRLLPDDEGAVAVVGVGVGVAVVTPVEDGLLQGRGDVGTRAGRVRATTHEDDHDTLPDRSGSRSFWDSGPDPGSGSPRGPVRTSVSCVSFCVG